MSRAASAAYLCSRVRVSVPAAGHERMIVRIPTVLRSYTSGRETVEIVAPATLGAAMDELDARFPGLRFRIIDEQHAVRPHIKLFIDGALLRDLAAPIPEAHELMIVGALSGG